MKFVFTKEEVAHALSISVSDFEECRGKLEATDFPRPVAGLYERWSILDVINWVNRAVNTPATATGFPDSPTERRLN